MSGENILVVEDGEDIQELIKYNLMNAACFLFICRLDK